MHQAWSTRVISKLVKMYTFISTCKIIVSASLAPLVHGQS